MTREQAVDLVIVFERLVGFLESINVLFFASGCYERQIDAFVRRVTPLMLAYFLHLS